MRMPSSCSGTTTTPRRSVGADNDDQGTTSQFKNMKITSRVLTSSYYFKLLLLSVGLIISSTSTSRSSTSPFSISGAEAFLIVRRTNTGRKTHTRKPTFSQNIIIINPDAGGRTPIRPLYLSSEEIQQKLTDQLEKLKEKDRSSKPLSPEDLKIIYEDEHIVVVDKPSGTLSVSTTSGKSDSSTIPTLADAVYQHIQTVLSVDQIVVHRLGMDTSGIMLFCKTIDAVRGMNALFRTRKITRQYEVLVCGHVAKDTGLINLPLMRDYEHPPFMRVSTDEHQKALLDLDPQIVGTKLLEAPKASLTHYQVIERENLEGGLPVTRLLLTSISGRTHQLNVHCAAIGHPIVQDSVYGYNGEAAAGGGLSDSERSEDGAASEEVQKQIFEQTKNMNMCVHSSVLKFRHPITKEEVEFKSKAPF